MNAAEQPVHEDEPVLALINQIKEGQLQAKTLSAEDRRRCVEVLRGEGYSHAEIAQILQVSERTIHRDIQQIRETHALAPDATFPERMIGELCQQAEVSIARLRRIAREKNTSAMERAMAESFAWKVCRELFEKLQSVGYLPKVPQSLVAEVYQHADVDAVATYDQLASEIRELAQVDSGLGREDPDGARKRDILLDEVHRGRLSVQLERLKQGQKEAEGGSSDGCA